MSRKTLGLSDIRTGQKAKIRSMPKRRGKDYLDLFSMTMKKTRLENERRTLDKRKENIEAEIKDLKREIEKMEQVAPAQFKHAKKNKLCRNAGAKSPLKAMVMGY
ncbi:MAG: hypothetical protein AAB197_07920 [Deltaproteobacteria bacterium]